VAHPFQRAAMLCFAAALYGMADRSELVFASEAARKKELLLGVGPRIAEAKPIGLVEKNIVSTLGKYDFCALEQALPTFTPNEWRAGKWWSTLASATNERGYETTVGALRLAEKLLALFCHHGKPIEDQNMLDIDETLCAVDDALFEYVRRRIPGA
jgi:hypothetical protein